MTSNALVTLVVAKENCFQKPFKTIKAIRISAYSVSLCSHPSAAKLLVYLLSRSELVHLAASSRLSGRRSGTPDSRTCWVDSEVQWVGSTFMWPLTLNSSEELSIRRRKSVNLSEVYKSKTCFDTLTLTCVFLTLNSCEDLGTFS